MDRWIGIIVAAGRGRRMGRTKQLLPWLDPRGRRPLVAAAFDSIAPACAAMVVVLGHDPAQVRAALGDRTFHFVKSDPDAEMFASVRAGISRAQQLDPHASILLQLGDHPEVGRQTLETLRHHQARAPRRALIPVFRSRGGHPVLIPPPVIASIVTFSDEGGLRRFWNLHPDSCLRIDVDDPTVVLDVDTPAQYARALRGRA